MKRHFLLQIALAFALLLGIVAYASRLLNLTGSWTLDLAGDDIATLAPATERYLRSLDTPLSITYFATAREHMPAHLKDLEPQVRRLLSALRERAPDRIDYRVIDPDQSGRAGIGYAASKKASSFSVRRVLHDEHSEQKIWSSLVIARANAPAVLVQSIKPEHLPHLEEYVIAQLEAGRAPPQPTIGVSAPPPFQLLAAFLNEVGPVVELDLNSDPTIPPEIDVLFWVQPAVATPEHVRQLLAFLASGRSAVLAGSAYQIGYSPAEGAISYWVHHAPPAWAQLLQPFGIRPVPDLLVDKNTGPVALDSGEVVAPFHLRVLPAFYNMKSFAAPGRGGLNFVAASALEVDPQAVQAKGFHAEIVGTTTESPRVLPLPTGSFTDADLTGGLPVPKQNLLVLLKPDDPWQGQLFVLASASPFQDGIINQPGYAHRVFLQNLIRTYGQPERVLRGRVEKGGAQRLVPPGALARFFWRFFAVFLVPLGFVGLGVRHYLRHSRPSWPAGRWGRQLGLACLVLFVGALVWRGRGPYLDLTADQLNTPSPLLGRLLQGTSLAAELIATHRASMPRQLKDAEDRIRTLLADCNIPLRVIRPDALTPDQRQALAAEGLVPFPAERVLNDTLATQYVWSSLRLLGNAHTIAVPRLDQRTLHHLEFLLAAASHSLQQGRKMRVAVISDSAPPLAGRSARRLPEEGPHRPRRHRRVQRLESPARRLSLRRPLHQSPHAEHARRRRCLVVDAAAPRLGSNLTSTESASRAGGQGHCRHAALQHPAAPVPRLGVSDGVLASAPIPRPRPLPPALWRRTAPRSALRPHPVAPRPRDPSQPHGRARVRPAKGRLAVLDPRRRPALRPYLADHSAPRRPALYLGESLCPATGRAK